MLLFKGDSGPRESQRYVERSLGIGLWSWNLETGSMEWSYGLLDLLGLQPNALTPSYAAMELRIHPDDRKPQHEVENLFRNFIPVERELRIVNSVGRVRWVRSRAEAILGPARSASNAIGICQDITKHRELQQAIKKGDDRFQKLIGLSEALIWIAEPNGSHPEFVSPRDQQPDHLGNSSAIEWASIVPSLELEAFNREWTNAVEGGRPFSIEHRLLLEDGKFALHQSEAVPIVDDLGKVTEWIGTSRNLQGASDSRNVTGKLTGSQIRAARAFVGWSLQRLSAVSQVRPGTIRGLEESNRPSAKHVSELAAIERAFNSAGVEFSFTADGKPGVWAR
jgi:PAS domain S-box-containing protein